jgi:hypothetical protein
LLRNNLRKEEENSRKVRASTVLRMIVEFNIRGLLIRGLDVRCYGCSLSSKSNLAVRLRELECGDELGEVVSILDGKAAKENSTVYMLVSKTESILMLMNTYAAKEESGTFQSLQCSRDGGRRSLYLQLLVHL